MGLIAACYVDCEGKDLWFSSKKSLSLPGG